MPDRKKAGPIIRTLLGSNHYLSLAPCDRMALINYIIDGFRLRANERSATA